MLCDIIYQIFFRPFAFDLCKILGYENCNHSIDLSNHFLTTKHLEESHGAVVQKGTKAFVLHAGFISTIEADQNCKWSPILLNIGGSLHIIIGTAIGNAFHGHAFKFVVWMMKLMLENLHLSSVSL